MTKRVDLTTLTPHHTLEGFYRFRDTHCYVNELGKIWNEKKSKFIIDEAGKGHLAGKNYYPIRSLGNDQPFLVHRVVAELFVEKPDIPGELQVNHIDGDKSNYAAYNLEWVTPSRNITHAHETGLFSINRAVLLKDLYTDEVRRFYSLGDCSRYLKIDSRRLSHYMKTKRTIPFRKKWDMVREGEPWNPIPRENIGKKYRKADNPVIAARTTDRKVVICADIRRASAVTGVKARRIERILYRTIHPKTHSCGPKSPETDWTFFYHVNDEETHLTIRKLFGAEVPRDSMDVAESASTDNLKGFWPSNPIVVKDTTTGDVRNYASVRAFCEEHGYNYDTVRHSVTLKRRWRTYEIDYL